MKTVRLKQLTNIQELFNANKLSLKMYQKADKAFFIQ